MTTYTEAGAEAPAPVPEPAAAPVPRAQWSRVPQVNLLPPEILANRRFRRLRQRLIGVGVGVLVLCGAGVVWAQGQVSAAQQDLATIQSQGVLLEKQKAGYADVPRTLAELDRVKAARESAMGADVLWYRFLGDLALNTPSTTELSSVVISMSGSTTAAPAADSPLVPPGLGTVKVAGKAEEFVDVAAWLEDVDKVHGLAGSGLESAAKGEGGGGSSVDGAASDAGAAAGGSGTDASGASSAENGVKFVGDAVVVPSALSHRYDRKAG